MNHFSKRILIVFPFCSERAISAVVGRFNYRVPGRTLQNKTGSNKRVSGSISVRPHPSTVSVGCLDTSVHPYALILVLGVDRWGITNLFYCCFLGGGVADTLLSAISSGTRYADIKIHRLLILYVVHFCRILTGQFWTQD